MPPPESQLAENLTEIPVAPERPNYLRTVPDEGSLEDQRSPTILERLVVWWRNAIDCIMKADERSDTFWNNMWIERAMVSSIIAGGDPELAKMRAVQLIYGQKRLLKNPKKSLKEPNKYGNFKVSRKTKIINGLTY